MTPALAPEPEAAALTQPRRAVAQRPTGRARNVLLTVGRSPLTLELARQLWAGGHRVCVTDTLRWTVCSASRAVAKTFVVTSPRISVAAYLDDILAIVQAEHIDVIIPVYEEAFHFAQDARLGAACELFAPSFACLRALHNKWQFMCMLERLGIATMPTFLIQSDAELARLDRSQAYALKPCYSRAAMRMVKLEPGQRLPTLGISPVNAYVAQQWIEGSRFCTYSVCRNGRVQAQGVYPVQYTIDGHSCVVFTAVEHAGIAAWTHTFAERTHLTGQASFDFIETDDGRLYAIECNPRTTSGVHLFARNGDLARAFFEDCPTPVVPRFGAVRQLAIGMVLYGWRKRAYPKNSVRGYLRTVLGTSDVIFDSRDIVPFFAQGLMFLELWRQSLRNRLSLPASFLYDYEWNG